MQHQITPTLTESALRGLACKCPRCGEGKLYAGFLELRPNGEVCGLDFALIDSADGRAIFSIMLAVGIAVDCADARAGRIPPRPFWREQPPRSGRHGL